MNWALQGLKYDEEQGAAQGRWTHCSPLLSVSRPRLRLILLPTLAPFHTHVQVDAAIYKLHTRRCCTLEFHQTNDSIVISGDKKGGIAIWDFDRVGVNQSVL